MVVTLENFLREKILNSRDALDIVESLVLSGEVSRFSSPERTTKAIIFRTGSGRNFAVEVNDVISRAYAEQVKLVFERAPGGTALDWPAVIDLFNGQLNEHQFENSAYKVKGANLEPGKQMSVIVTTEQALKGLIDWYSTASIPKVSSAERIRAHALAHYITPARERGDATVTILASKIHDELGLTMNHANVYQALNGQMFLSLCALSAPVISGPLNGARTTFTYSLEERAIPMAGLKPSATNLILYGPPGTGKTYATAVEAVRLCMGEGATPFLEPERRAELMEQYRALVDAGRIDFVTFHQSYSYEDFVEGLRPTTETGDMRAEQEDAIVAPASGGFSLRSIDGIFKLICERARSDRGDAKSAARLERQRPVFKMSLGRRGSQEDRITEGLTDQLVHLGWGGDIDWSDERFDSFEEIRREWKEKKDPEASGKDPNIEMIYSLRTAMQIGDYVVLADGRDAIRAFGIIKGDYYYDADAPYHRHRREVEWIWQDGNGVKRDTFYKSFFRQHSVYELNPAMIDWVALESIVHGDDARAAGAQARPYVLVIDEINRANISKVFGELITLLEPDKRLGEVNEIKVKLPYSDGPAFGVPANLHIIGTMNTADRSIALLDTALRRRFAFRELMPQPSLLKEVDGIDLARLLGTINERIEYLFDREHQIGHAYFIGCASRDDIDEVMRHKVIPLLAEYFYEDWNKVAAVLGDTGEAEGNFAGGFLDRKKLNSPRGMEGDGDVTPRFRWSVRERLDYSNLVQG